MREQREEEAGGGSAPGVDALECPAEGGVLACRQRAASHCYWTEASLNSTVDVRVAISNSLAWFGFTPQKFI